ncbi:hypothetical protein GW764_00600 [Candidatus Parcubacteria bacterium]|nr:hypothetical protein [Candidatus Parcubacteria bacterium]
MTDRRKFVKANSKEFISKGSQKNLNNASNSAKNSQKYKEDNNPFYFVDFRINIAPDGKVIDYRAESFSGSKRNLKILKGSASSDLQDSLRGGGLCLVRKVNEKKDPRGKVEYFVLVQIIDETKDLLFGWDDRSNSWTSFQSFDRCCVLFKAGRSQDQEKLPQKGCDAHIKWDVRPIKVEYFNLKKRFFIVVVELVEEKTSQNAIHQQIEKGYRLPHSSSVDGECVENVA